MDPLEAKRSVMVVEKLDLLGGESYESNGVMRIAGTTAPVSYTHLDVYKRQVRVDGECL